MLNFVFENKTKLIFGKDTEKQVGEYTKKYGNKVLLHYGGGSIKKFGLYDAVVKSLQENDVDFIELGGVLPNPRLSLVEEGIELCRKEDVDFILAVGGGSVIDSAKAIAMGVPHLGNVWEDFFMTGNPIKEALPVGVVLTLPAAGSEASIYTVISNTEIQLKKGYGHLLLQPVFSILNPEITYTLPDYQTACGAVDMIGHVFERYFTNTENNEITDRIGESIIKTVVNNAPKAIADNKDYNSRAEIMWAGVLAHNDIAGTGRVQDWASHGLEHELSALYDIAHGAGLAMIYPAWMKYVYKHKPMLFIQLGERVFDLNMDGLNEDDASMKTIEALEHFYKSIGMPTRMSDFDIDDSRIEEMANKITANDTKTIGNFVKLNKQDVINIYKLAL